MTDADWLGCNNPLAMIEAVRYRAGLRKLRRLAAACCQESANWLTSRGSQRAATILARFLDGENGEQVAWQHLDEVVVQETTAPASLQLCGALPCVQQFGLHPVESVRQMVRTLASAIAVENAPAQQESAARFCDLMREVLLPPGPLMPRSVEWLRWHGRTVERLARTIQQEDRYEEMPVLGDALEEAGCPEERILRHCRQAPFHCCGCWVLDLLLIGRE
jgi:hypothetical protein